MKDPLEYLQGVYNVTPTPFDADGELDEDSLATLVDFIVARGVDGLTILGVMGETAKVSADERARIIAGVVETAAGRVPVCVGTSHSGTRQCAARSRQAEALGARAVMVAPPQLARASDEALRRHYLTVAEAIDTPIVMQDHPASSGVVMRPDFIAALAEESAQCRFLKLEDPPTPLKVSQVLAANPAVRVFGGSGGLMFLEELRHGAGGTMTGFAFPEILVEIHRRWQAGDEDGAAEVFYRYCPLIRFESQPRISLMLRKQIYARRGALRTPAARAPFTPVDAGTLRDLEDLLARLGLAEAD